MQDTSVLHDRKSFSTPDSPIVHIHACHAMMLKCKSVAASSTNLAACRFCTSFLDQIIKPLQDKGHLQVSQKAPNKFGLDQLILSLHFLKEIRGTEVVILQTIKAR